MRENHLWKKAESIRFSTGADIVGNFSIGFDRRIPEETKDALMRFVYWVEDRFSLPITLWVDFKYNHYLIGKNGKPVGYRFYWVDFENYPTFLKEEDIPVIELAVRTEHQTMEEILKSFTQAISLYYSWLTNAITQDTMPEESDVDAVLQAYWQDR